MILFSTADANGFQESHSKVTPESSDLYFDWSSATKTANDTKNNGAVTDNSHILKDGTYEVPLKTYAIDETRESALKPYLNTSATVTVKNGQATLDLVEDSKGLNQASLGDFSFNGYAAKHDKNHWTVTLPVAMLNQHITSHVNIMLGGSFVFMSPTFDLSLDIQKYLDATEHAPNTNDDKNNASTSPDKKPDAPTTSVSEETHELSILQDPKSENKGKPSVAAQYLLHTIKLVKNSDGSYYAYITTNTPKTMGNAPITFTDTQHEPKVVSTTLVNDNYQSVIRLKLSASEISAPILANIHVKFTIQGVMSYDHPYVIQLVIGKSSDADSSKSSSMSSSSSSSSEKAKSSSASSKISSSSSSEKAKSSSASSKNSNSSSSEKAKCSSASSKISSSSSSEKAKSSSESSKTSSSSAKSSSTTPVKKPDAPTKPVNEETRSLTVLQADSDKPSMAGKYMINTVKLTKNSNGSYYAYVTTNTPANMGETPVTFTDTSHHSEVISNTLINGFYQSVVRLTLSPSEISSPISTNIHVIVPGINYNNLYVIRLVIGDTAISNIDDSKNSSSSDKPKKPSDSDQPKISSSESSKNPSQSSKISSSSSSEKPKSSSQSSKINSSSSSEKAKNSSQSSKISSSSSSEKAKNSSESSKISNSSSSEKAKSSSQSSKTSSSSAKCSSTTPVKKPDGPTKPVTSETRNLRILQDKSDKPSMAAKYILDTMKLDENTDGSYYAYVTTHTPAMMGKQPITFTDTQRTAKFMSTKLINDYYQSVIRIKLSASELAAPILTHIHVEFKQPIAYNDTYGIRLVIASSANYSSKSSSESSKTNSLSSSENTKSSSTTPITKPDTPKTDITEECVV
ncbi:NEAT domain-containing protein [Weissella confusa]